MPATPLTLRERLGLYERLLRLDKPIGILLLLWPTLWGLWLSAGGKPHPMIVWIFVLGTVLMRSAGCAINDYADRDFDPHVERTRDRPLASGKIGRGEALALAAVLALLALALIVPLRNILLLQLAGVAAFLAASYPFTKRFLAIPQAYLGIAFGFGIPMAYAAQLDTVPTAAWWLLAANVFWAVAYDTEYAMVDRADDLKIGIRTSAITFGRFDVAAIMLCYAAAFGILAHLGTRMHMGWAYFGGLAVASALAVHHFLLIRHRDPAACFRAFRHNNYVGAAIFAGIAIEFAQRRGWPFVEYLP